MMNLSINLTLGSPGADSVLNTAPAEEGAADSFSQALADELSGQELAPSVTLADAEGAEPILPELIATWQPVAVTEETVTGKDGQIWLDDPIAGLPVATDEAEALAVIGEEDKPWLDIIEKAKSYSPALQANKSSHDSVPELPPAAEPEAAALPGMAVASGQTDTALLSGAQLPANAGQAPSEVVPVLADTLPDVVTAPDTALPGAQPAASADTTAVQLPLTAGPQEGTKPLQPEPANSPTSTVTAAALSDGAEVAAPVATPSLSAGVSQASAADTATPADTVDTQHSAQQPATLSAVTVASSETPAAPAQQTAQLNKVTVQPVAAGAAAEAEVVAAVSTADAVQQAAVMTETLASAGAVSRPVQATASEKAPAANAFAEHLKTQNQTLAQQQQQQSGAEQQPGQGQAKASAGLEPVAVNLPAASAGPVPVFASHLQQAAEATSAQTPLVQPLSHSSLTATGHTALSARPADITPWQAPLALADPSAAQQIKDRVMVQIQHKLQTAEVQLHPEDLGSMQIKLNLQQDQLSVQFIVQQGAAKEALEQQMPRLRDMLEQQGILLSEGQVEQRQGGSGHEQQQSRQSQAHDADIDVAPVQTVQMRVSDRVVDFYA